MHEGDSLAVHVAVDALVTLLSVPIVRYSLRVVETWQDGRLTSLTGETPLQSPPDLKLRPWESVVWRRARS